MSDTMQTTFGDMGLEPVMSVAPHPNDCVYCEDTKQEERRFACLESVDGKFWMYRDECIEHEQELVRAVLEGVIEWSDEYNASAECGDQYGYLVFENPEPMRENVREAIIDLDEYDESVELDDAFVNDIMDDLEVHTDFSTTCGYYGSSPHDVHFDSFDWGEVEEQVDLSAFPVLMELHKRGNLEEILGNLENTFCIYHRSRAIYEDGKFVRHDYEDFVIGGDYPHILLTNNTDLRYWYGCTEEALREVYTTKLAELAEG